MIDVCVRQNVEKKNMVAKMASSPLINSTVFFSPRQPPDKSIIVHSLTANLSVAFAILFTAGAGKKKRAIERKSIDLSLMSIRKPREKDVSK